MNTYTVSFFGHRDFCEHHKCEEKLEEIIRSAISSHKYVNFLVLPYITSEFKNNEDYFEKYYDNIEICPASELAHFKSAITLRNRKVTLLFAL